MKFQQFARQILPPLIIKVLKPKPKYGWFGDYASWSQAKAECVGYESNEIFDKLKIAADRVKKGEAKFERDTVLFYEEQFNWQILSCLMLIAAQEEGVLHVTDFGGSTASFFYQHRKIIKKAKDLKWGIIEQSHIVDYGRKNLLEQGLNFYYSVTQCLQEQKTQTLLLSSVLQYLEHPIEKLKELIELKFKYIIIDRTAFTLSDRHEITIQKINPRIYHASYPAWFFNEAKFLELFSDYEIFLAFDNSDYTNRKKTFFKGYFLVRKPVRND